MRMVSTLYTLQIVLAVSVVWRPSHAVHQLSCGETITLTTSTATTYRFGNFTNPYGTGLSCTFNFNLLDASERIISRLFPQCTSGEDVLQINSDGNNLCCFNCARPISGPSSSLHVSFSTDTTTGPKELGFEIMIVTGKDESKCVSPSSNISVTVGPSPVIITSPGFPNKYHSNSDCSYIINPQDSSKGFSLTFDVISLDYDGRCYDTITLGIYNKDPVNICTNYTTGNLFLPNERYTSGGETYLHFKSDEMYESYGFRVTIVQVDLGATQPPTAASTTTVQTVETTTSETTAASITAAQTTETTAALPTAAQTTKTTAASTTAAQTTETTIKSTLSESTPSSEATAVPATVQTVSSTITVPTADSTNTVQTVETTTSETTAASTTAAQTIEASTAAQTTKTTAASTPAAQTTETTAASPTAAQTTETTAASTTVRTTAETTIKSTLSESTPSSEATAVPATVQTLSSPITVPTADSTTVESTAAPSHSDPTTGIQNPSQTDGTIEPMNMLIITAVASSAVILLPVVVVFACFLKRKKASRILSNREEMFQNTIFIGQGNETFSGPSVEQYEQIPADKMLSESQIKSLKNRAGSGGDYESRANLPGEDHTYQGLIEARQATNKAFSESCNSQLDDYDSPHDSVSNDH